MIKYKMQYHTPRGYNDRKPGKENPLPVRTDPNPEPDEQPPGPSPKRRKKSIYEISFDVV